MSATTIGGSTVNSHTVATPTGVVFKDVFFHGNCGTRFDNILVEAVAPEPVRLALMALGGLLFLRRRV